MSLLTSADLPTCLVVTSWAWLVNSEPLSCRSIGEIMGCSSESGLCHRHSVLENARSSLLSMCEAKSALTSPSNTRNALRHCKYLCME